MFSRYMWGGPLLLAATVLAPAQPSGVAPPLDIIVARMAQARAVNQALLHPYVVTRLYVLFGNERDNKKSEVTAEVDFVPPNVKKYSISATSGSGIGKRIVRRMLDGETQIVKNYGATDITPANYDFRFIGEEELDGRRCYLIELLPKRRDKALLAGNAWIDAETYRLRQTRAKPAKSPSWWLKDIRVEFSYGEVDGMWLQIASEFSARVRIFGRHTMTSQDVSYEASIPAEEETPAMTALLLPTGLSPRCPTSCAAPLSVTQR